MAKTDYYEVLGVAKNATRDDIKKAYRKVAVKYHPDRNPGDSSAEDMFKAAAEAYEVLSDDQKRQAYDQFGFAGVDGMSGNGGGGFSSAYRDFEDIFGDFSGIFDSFFGGGRRGGRGRSGPRRGSDIKVELEVSFKDAAFGCVKEITYPRTVHCSSCSGTGSQGDGTRRTCPTCGGVGQVRRSQGFFSVATVCPDCQGEGQIVENPCRSCGGAGVEQRRSTVKVTIPAGIDTGKRLSVPGQGEAGPNGAQAGDLYVFLRVAPHEYFERDGDDLYCLIPVSFTQAALGADVFIPSLDGERITAKVPSGSQNGDVIRVKGWGVPRLNHSSKRGDLYVKLRVMVPERVHGKVKHLLKELAEVEAASSEPDPVPLSSLR